MLQISRKTSKESQGIPKIAAWLLWGIGFSESSKNFRIKPKDFASDYLVEPLRLCPLSWKQSPSLTMPLTFCLMTQFFHSLWGFSTLIVSAISFAKAANLLHPSCLGGRVYNVYVLNLRGCLSQLVPIWKVPLYPRDSNDVTRWNRRQYGEPWYLK